MNIRDERGSAESALVLIPLLLLFLIGMQIAYAIHARNVDSVANQNYASVRAISGDLLPEDEVVHIESGGDGQNLDLLVTHHQRAITDFLPRIFSSSNSPRNIAVSGLAIIENQR